MKIAITGHTKGIGKKLYDRYQPNALGFSKSTGYDIINPNDRARIVAQSVDCDIFVNNAHAGFGQVLLLIDLFRVWKDQKKTIINVGSKISEIVLPVERQNLLVYQSVKVALREMSKKLTATNTSCIITYKALDYVATESALQEFKNVPRSFFMTEDQAVDILMN